jgi:putative transposase
MANSFTQLYVHCVWSTKNREPLIGRGVESRVWSTIAETAHRHGIHVNKVGGIENHVHVLLELPRTMGIAEMMKQVKGGSSQAIRKSRVLHESFAWQDGYGAFTVSKSVVQEVVDYIENQRAHHQQMTFEEEFVQFLNRHGIEYDEKYLWG